MNANDKHALLAKKVLLAVVAASVMGSFGVSAEAADQSTTTVLAQEQNNGNSNGDFSNGAEQKVENATYDKIIVRNKTKVTLTDSTITGRKEEHHDPEDSDGSYHGGLTHADVAAQIQNEGTQLIAKDVKFTGEVSADSGSKVQITGGSVKAGNYYYKDGTTESLATEIGARDRGIITLDNVDIQSNLGAFDGGEIHVSNSNVNAKYSIYAEGDDTKITLNSPNGTINVGELGIEADNGANITINGGNVNTSYLIADGNFNSDKDNTNTVITLNGSKNDIYTVTKDIDAENGGTIQITGGTVNAKNIIFADGEKSAITLNSTNGTINVGELGIEADNGASITVNGGNVNTSYLIADGNFNSDKDNTNTVITLNGSKNDTYTVTKGIAATNGGTIQITGGTLKADNLKNIMYGFKVPDEDKTYNTADNSIILSDKGSISTMSDQIYKNAASATQKESGEITNTGIDFKGGSLIINDAKYTQAYTNSAQAELKKQGGTKLTMTGTLVKEDTGDVIKDITVDDASQKYGSDTELDKVTAKADHNLLVGSKDNNLANKDIDGISVKQQVENGFAVGKLDLGDGYGVIITNGKEVTLGGSAGGSIITVGGKDQEVKVVVGTDKAGTKDSTGTLTIGNGAATSDTSYTLNGTVAVNKDSTLNSKGQTTITKGLQVNDGTVNVQKGMLNTTDLTVTGVSNVLGTVKADTVNVKGATLTIGNKDNAGNVTVEKANLQGGTLFLDPAWKDKGTINDASGFAVKTITDADGAYIVGQNAVLSLGADLDAAKQVFAKTRETWGKDDITSAAYIASSINMKNGSLTVDGSLTQNPAAVAANGSVHFADHSLLMVDGDKTKSTAAITGVTDVKVADSAKLYIDNAKKNTTYQIIDGSKDGWKADNVISNNKLLKFNVTDTGKNTYDVTSYSNSVKDVYGNTLLTGNVYDAALEAGGVAADFVNNASDDHYNVNDTAKISALNSAAAMSELAGIDHSMYAASNLFTDAVADHMSLASQKDHDSDIWAKYIHSKENMDGLAIAGTGSKYDTTYNGVVVGADLHKQGKATIGAALSYIDGSVEGNTLAASTKNDTTYYGASIYGSMQNDDSAIIGDISYLHGKNDITQYNSGMTLTASPKSDAFSVGVRAEKSIKAGAGKFVPYAGVRYMRLSTGNYTNSIGMHYDADDMNLWLLPVGMKYSTDIKNGSWTIRPVAEVGYVWNLGDRDATQTVGFGSASDRFGYDVTDTGYYLGRLVIEAQKGNMTYGVGYEYQKGDSVKANTWMANVNWKF